MISDFDNYDIILILLNSIIIALIISFHIQSHTSDCRGQLLSKTRSLDGQTCTRQAKLSIHDIQHPIEMLPIIKKS